MAVADQAQEQLSGGRLNAAIVRGIVATHSRFTGRGPTRAHAFFRGNVVVVILRDTLTTAERSLAANGSHETVRSMRRAVERAMEPELASLVGTLTGRAVEAVLSAWNADPDVSMEVFLLDGPVAGAGSPALPVP